MAESLGLNTRSSTAARLKRSLGQSSTGHTIMSANSLPWGSNRDRSVGMFAFGGIPLLRRYSRHCSADHFVLDVQAMRFSCEHYSFFESGLLRNDQPAIAAAEMRVPAAEGAVSPDSAISSAMDASSPNRFLGHGSCSRRRGSVACRGNFGAENGSR